MGTGQGRGGVGMLLSGRVFSSFGLCETWLGDLETESSLRTSWISEAGLDSWQSPSFVVKSGRQNRPVLK